MTQAISPKRVAAQLVGMPFKDAVEFVPKQISVLKVRVLENKDTGQKLNGSMDFDVNRINVVIKDGKVESAEVG